MWYSRLHKNKGGGGFMEILSSLYMYIVHISITLTYIYIYTHIYISNMFNPRQKVIQVSHMYL